MRNMLTSKEEKHINLIYVKMQCDSLRNCPISGSGVHPPPPLSSAASDTRHVAVSGMKPQTVHDSRSTPGKHLTICHQNLNIALNALF